MNYSILYMNVLNEWLIGFPEGEMCGGSVKVIGN